MMFKERFLDSLDQTKSTVASFTVGIIEDFKLKRELENHVFYMACRNDNYVRVVIDLWNEFCEREINSLKTHKRLYYIYRNHSGEWFE